MEPLLLPLGAAQILLMDEPPQITVTLNPNGSVSISGPINNKILCYGLLEAGRKALDDYVPQAAPEIVIPYPRSNGRLNG
jgi:hypothetical protein